MRICSVAEPFAGTLRYLSEPITTGRVVSMDLMSAISRLAIGMPAVEVESGISFPIDHMITAGLFLAALTISLMSSSPLASKNRW